MLGKLLGQVFRRGRSTRSADTRPPLAGGASPKLAAAYADLIARATRHAQAADWALAEKAIAEAQALDPGHSEGHDLLGNVLRGRDRIEQALESYQRAISIDPDCVSALSNAALCMRDLGRLEDARKFLERAVMLDPANPVIAMNLAALRFDTGRFDEAMSMIDCVLRAHPEFDDAHVVRGTRLLRRGNYDEGWIDYEKRDRNAGRAGPANFDYPVWDGSPMANGFLLVCGEQGLGDQIMFASCIDALLRIVPNCIIECDARLKALFARSFPAARCYVQRTSGEEIWRRDGMTPVAKTWIGSLPGRFRRRAADFPSRLRYLQADPGRVAHWQAQLDGLGAGLKIGISWRGGIGSTRRALRSIELEQWVPLLQHGGAHFVSLQYGDCREEIERVCVAFGVRIAHWPAAIDDIDETAALVSALDLVVSVQTTVVHLAGALGIPVRALVPAVPEWRYGEAGERMAWYPSVRIHRQGALGDWQTVLREIGAALEAEIVWARPRAPG